jgi:NAD(P)-dependent dehydrogenase (short-subunit alcohol dehydrogenase family)
MTKPEVPLPPLTADALKQAARTLEAVAADRRALAHLSDDERIEFLRAVGQVAHPERDDKRRLAKAMRAKERREKAILDRATKAAAGIRQARREAVFMAPQLVSDTQARRPELPLLEKAKHCYVCKAEYRRLHFFYDSMCEACAELNYAKRFQTCDLNGRTALITGARVKIGYQAGLMLLRAGARVIVTTRFPHDAALRYAREADFDAWKGRLHIHGLDLRHAPSVELFTHLIQEQHGRLDVLINNAAQTVRRPPGFYRHLQEQESHDVPPELGALLEGHRTIAAELRGLTAGGAIAQTGWQNSDPGQGIHSSAALSMLPYTHEKIAARELLFPDGKLDADLQQVDLRAVNTWRLTLAEVATAEMLEVHLVNAVAPFILCGKLKPLMLKDRSTPGHVVNVSAMEGSFSRKTKTDKHPHTNMAKAALNMMTLTSAPDYAQGNIFMNAVDTGWVTDEDPALHADRKREELDFQPPLDIVDGAARVIDPVFNAVRTGQHVFGRFFKDYRETPW